MKKKGKWLKFLSIALTVTLLAACTNSNQTTPADGTNTGGTTEPGGASGDYDFYIFNTKGENADALQDAVDTYAAETGQTVRVFSLGSGTDSSDVLNTEMNSNNKPTIFSIMNLQELKGWVEGGFARDVSDAQTDEFRELVDEIPSGLYLTNDGEVNYGIPYNVEGYGYIVDRLMLSDLFGEDQVEAVLADIKTATYDEWEALVVALDDYIQNDTVGSVTLSGNDYSFVEEKGEYSSELTGVFATAGSQTWTYGDHLINVAIDAVFENPAAAEGATAEEIDTLIGPFEAYARALDLKTSYAAGANGPLNRSPEFINTTTASYDAQIQLFADHKAVFVKQGNWVYTNIQNVNEDIVDTLTFVPVKLPLSEADIQVDGLSVEDMASSIPVFVPNYYAINAQSSEEEQANAERFLYWLNTSEAGQRYVIEDMAFIPYNADTETTTLENSLSQSIMEYMSSGDTLTNAYAGAPTNWSGDTVGQRIMEEYLTKAEWTEEDYSDIANYAVDQWKSMGAY